ncbi:ABC transporter permease [Halobaculum gomorrense]|uniref:Putative ABC transport system permease protein n=1 Tax=Halobaculum gomorrense TaxID=43928 RepID=A0A1M5SUM6_9EURY|nr:ABC transporter permease [Halobaculum gomorrense]SHH42216.1 putative ABC transport system permease protein [Halobaculum gomorrense]
MRLLDRLWGSFPAVLMARRNVARAKTRSALAVAVILIGVVAIGAIGAGGVAFQESQFETLGSIGADLQVFPGEDNEHGYLSAADVGRIDRVSGQAEIVPLNRENADAIEGGSTVGTATLYGVDDPASLYEVREGSIPANWRSGVLVGSTLADRYDLRPGSKVTLGRTTVEDGRTVRRTEEYRVKAVLAQAGQADIANPNQAFVLPPSEFDDGAYAQVIVRAEDATAANETAMEIKRTFNGRRQIVSVFERGDIAEQIDEAFRLINLFLVGIGAISLVVAGVSIANVMLMSAIERREEIGVLRAVGYQKLDIVRIMLAEATLLGALGSLLGGAVTLAVVAAINDALLGDPFAFPTGSLRYVAAGMGFGVIASLIAGIYPAWAAARERPVEALRG